MTNREYINSLTDEELADSFYFCDCPIGKIYRIAQAKNGNIICERDELIKSCKEYTWDYHQQVREVCIKCKTKWLSAERRKD